MTVDVCEVLRVGKCLGMIGWDAGIRTPIRRSRVCSLTVRRRPNSTLYFSRARSRGIQMLLRSTLKHQMMKWLPAGRLAGLFALGRLGRRLDGATNPKATSAISPRSSTPPARAQLETYCGDRRTRHRRANGAGHDPLAGRRADRGRRQYDLPRLGRRPEGQERRHSAAARDPGPPQPPGSRLRPGADPARWPGWLGAARDAAGAAPAAIRRGDDGGGADHRRHDREGEERVAQRAAAAPHAAARRAIRFPWPMVVGGIVPADLADARRAARAGMAAAAAADSCRG